MMTMGAGRELAQRIEGATTAAELRRLLLEPVAPLADTLSALAQGARALDADLLVLLLASGVSARAVMSNPHLTPEHDDLLAQWGVARLRGERAPGAAEDARDLLLWLVRAGRLALDGVGGRRLVALLTDEGAGEYLQGIAADLLVRHPHLDAATFDLLWERAPGLRVHLAMGARATTAQRLALLDDPQGLAFGFFARNETLRRDPPIRARLLTDPKAAQSPILKMLVMDGEAGDCRRLFGALVASDPRRAVEALVEGEGRVQQHLSRADLLPLLSHPDRQLREQAGRVLGTVTVLRTR